MHLSNKTFITAILLVTLLGGGMFFLINSSRKSTDNMQNLPLDQSVSEGDQGSLGNVQNEPGDSAPPSDDNDAIELTGSSGSYIAYSDENYEENVNKKRVIFFHAGWCPTCRAADAEFNANLSEIPEEVVILKTDYDTADELKDEYDITYQHTFVQVDENGNEITKWNGGAIDEIVQNIK